MYIKLSFGKIFNLLEDELTTEDIRRMSGEEVRKIEALQETVLIEKELKESEKIYKETGCIISCL